MRPRVYCDYHGLVADNTYALDTRASADDLDSLADGPQIGMKLTFYMDDGDGEGNPDDLLVDGEIDRLELWGWVARVDPSTWRHHSEEPA